MWYNSHKEIQNNRMEIQYNEGVDYSYPVIKTIFSQMDYTLIKTIQRKWKQLSLSQLYQEACLSEPASSRTQTMASQL